MRALMKNGCKSLTGETPSLSTSTATTTGTSAQQPQPQQSQTSAAIPMRGSGSVMLKSGDRSQSFNSVSGDGSSNINPVAASAPSPKGTFVRQFQPARKPSDTPESPSRSKANSDATAHVEVEQDTSSSSSSSPPASGLSSLSSSVDSSTISTALASAIAASPTNSGTISTSASPLSRSSTVALADSRKSSINHHNNNEEPSLGGTEGNKERADSRGLSPHSRATRETLCKINKQEDTNNKDENATTENAESESLISGSSIKPPTTPAVSYPSKILKSTGAPSPPLTSSSSGFDATTNEESLPTTSTSEKAGWLRKKGKKRYFVLKDGVLSWFVQPKQEQSGKTAKGFLILSECSISKSANRASEGGFAFMLCKKASADDQLSSSGNEFGSPTSSSPPSSLPGSQLPSPTSRHKKKTEYVLIANSAEEMEEWISVAIKNGATADSKTFATRSYRHSGSIESSELQSTMGEMSLEGVDKSGWLEKKGRKRWFMLRNKTLSWYKAPPSASEAAQPHTDASAGSVTVERCKVQRSSQKIKGKYSLTIFAEDVSVKHKNYVLFHPEEDEVKSWIKALVEKGGAVKLAAASADPAAETKRFIFGVPLEELLKREGQEELGVPLIVQQCVEYIKQYGTDVEGIFRVSGDSLDVAYIKESFEGAAAEGEPYPKLTDITNDVHAVTGVLKSFLREMEPPLLSYELYESFIQAVGEDLSVTKALIERLPEANQKFLSHLLFFLHDISTHSEQTKMAPSNLAIVFAPNMFKSKQALVELTYSAQAGSMMRTMITRCHDLFPHAAASSSGGRGNTPSPLSGSAAPFRYSMPFDIVLASKNASSSTPSPASSAPTSGGPARPSRLPPAMPLPAVPPATGRRPVSISPSAGIGGLGGGSTIPGRPPPPLPAGPVPTGGRGRGAGGPPPIGGRGRPPAVPARGGGRGVPGSFVQQPSHASVPPSLPSSATDTETNPSEQQ